MKFGGTESVDFNEHISYETLCANWYHLYNLKNVKNTHGGAFLLANLQANILQEAFLACFWINAGDWKLVSDSLTILIK